MVAVVSQSLPQALPAPGLSARSVSAGNLGLTNYGRQAASFVAKRNSSYLVPTGGTVTLPTPTGSGAFISLTVFGTGTTTLSGTISVNGSTLSSFVVTPDQTLIICDASATHGWV